MILGLDVSTSKIGYCIIDYNKNLICCDVMKLKPLQLEDRAVIFCDFIKTIKKQYKIKEVFIEQPFSMFGGGKTTAMTMSKLQRFNGMCCYILSQIYEVEAVLVNPNSARSVLGIKVPRKVPGKEKKKAIIENISERFGEQFQYNLTRQGNPQPGTDDRADALVVALAGPLLLDT